MLTKDMINAVYRVIIWITSAGVFFCFKLSYLMIKLVCVPGARDLVNITEVKMPRRNR